MCAPSTACEYSFEFFLHPPCVWMLINSFECLNGQGIKTRANGKLSWRCTFLGCLSQLKWKSCTIALVINRNSVIFKKSVLQSQHRRSEFINERVKVLSQRCWNVSSHFFKWVYGNPWPWLVGIGRIPVYHVDYIPVFIHLSIHPSIHPSIHLSIFTLSKSAVFHKL